MQQEAVVVPGARDVRGTLDLPDGTDGTAPHDGAGAAPGSGGGTASSAADATVPSAVVVACPPHPQFGGNRRDRRLRAVAEGLAGHGVATLRFDYGAWDEGRGERADAANAVDWARERFPGVPVGLFGYSFGAVTALRVAAEDPDLAAVSVLAPDRAAVEALGAVAAPLQVLYGERDATVDWEPVVERARELNDAGRDPPVDLVACPADHHFVGQDRKVADAVSGFLGAHLR